jgi:hypothetical protein
VFCALDLGHEESRLPNIVLSADRPPYRMTSAILQAMKVTGRAKLDPFRTSKLDRTGLC